LENREALALSERDWRSGAFPARFRWALSRSIKLVAVSDAVAGGGAVAGAALKARQKATTRARDGMHTPPSTAYGVS
jgi:hypothetical protein